MQLGANDDAALTSGVIADTLVLNQQFKNISIIGDGYTTYKHGMLCQAGSGIIIRNVTVSSFHHGIAIRSGDVHIDSVNTYNCGFTSIVVKSDTCIPKIHHRNLFILNNSGSDSLVFSLA